MKLNELMTVNKDEEQVFVTDFYTKVTKDIDSLEKTIDKFEKKKQARLDLITKLGEMEISEAKGYIESKEYETDEYLGKTPKKVESNAIDATE